MSENTINSFSKGLNKDIDKRLLSNDSYFDAKNITITGEGNFLSAKNIKGTTFVRELIGNHSAANILGAFECNGLYMPNTYPSQTLEETNRSIIIFLVYQDSTKVSSILLHDCVRSKTHTLISDSELDFPIDGSVDAEVFGESNTSKIYFTDFTNEFRLIKATVDVLNPLANVHSLSLIPYSPLDKILFKKVIEGGTLLSGTYQFAYRYYNTVNNKYTKWSLLTNPIPIYPASFDLGYDQIFGGLPSEAASKSIVISIEKDLTGIAQYYDAVQLAVVKNVLGSSLPSTIAYTTAILEEWYSQSEIVYDGSGVETQIDLSEIVVDDAPIKTAKTLTSKDNVLFAGNIKYSDLEFDAPSFSDAYAITKNVGCGSVYEPVSQNTNDPRFLAIDVLEGTLIQNQPYLKEVNPISGNAGYNFYFVLSNLKAGNIFTLYLSVNNSTYTYIVKKNLSQSQTIQEIATGIDAFLSPVLYQASTEIVGDNIRIFGTAFNGGPLTTFFLIRTYAGLNVGVEEVVNSNRFEEESFDFAYKNPNNSVFRKGYFRDEQYRFGIVYNDGKSWSLPKPFDFSDNTIHKKTGTRYTIQNVNYSPGDSSDSFVRGLTVVYLDQNITYKVGDYLIIEGSGTFEDGPLMIVSPPQTFDNLVIGGASSYNPLTKEYTSSRVMVDGQFNYQSPLGFAYHRPSKYSHANSVDFKFPSRRTGEFGIFDDTINPNINALGLKVEGITNHPEWAKAFAIVRTKRIKDILYQSAHIPVVAAMPTANYNVIGSVAACDDKAGSYEFGSFGPKKFSQSWARNIYRNTDSFGSVYNEGKYAYQTGGGGGTVNFHISFLLPPEYLYNNNGTSYNFSHLTGTNIEIVDAVSFFMTPPIDVADNIIDYGVNPADQQALAFRADGKYSFYYQKNQLRNSLLFNEFIKSQHPNNGSSKVLDAIAMSYNGSYATFPSTGSDKITDKFKVVNRFFDFSGVSLENHGPSVRIQKGIVLFLEDIYGDLSFQSVKFPAFTPSEMNISNVLSWCRDATYTNKGFYQIPDVNARRDDNVGTVNENNIISSYNSGIVAASPIVNITAGKSDDRYGELETVHEYIFTGVYEKINSPSDSFDVEIFGGDCFISKTNVKVNDTHLGIFDGGGLGCDRGDTTNRQVRAYDDLCEVLSYYVESEVNCDLQANKFVYPVYDKSSIFEFKSQFTYDYNFGYSVQNEAKVFVSKNKLDSERSSFPSRIISSDVKIYQSNIEGFDRFRALSFYDLPETYGAITKLIKLNNENVFCLQEDAVSALPINKKIIEDGNGNQLAINSSTLINTPSYIMTKNGCQHLKTVVASDRSIFFVDARRKEVLSIGDNSGKISDIGMYSYFQEKLDSSKKIPEHLLYGWYDFDEEHYIVGQNAWTDTTYTNGSILNEVPKDPYYIVFSSKTNSWISELVLDKEIKCLVYANNQFYGIAKDLNVELHKMYTGNYGELFGGVQDSSIKLVVNPNEPLGKVFDSLRIDCLNKLTEAIITTDKETASQITTMNLSIKNRHDSYELPILRDANGQRIRGKYIILQLQTDNSNNNEVSINNVMTKYRIEGRTFR